MEEILDAFRHFWGTMSCWDNNLLFDYSLSKSCGESEEGFERSGIDTSGLQSGF